MTNPLRPHAFQPAAPRRLVILAPHPDDETLGCGLLITRAARAGLGIAVVVLTDGQASHPGSLRWPPAQLGSVRRGELRRAMARLGAARVPVRFLGWEDGQLAADASVLRLRTVLRALRAGAVLATSPDDHHDDHRATWRLAVAASAGLRIAVRSYAVWSRLAATPGARARDPGTAAKRWAMHAHRTQVGPYIADDPAGFTLAADTLARLLREPEIFA